MFHVPFTFSFTEAQSAYYEKKKSNIEGYFNEITFNILNRKIP